MLVKLFLLAVNLFAAPAGAAEPPEPAPAASRAELPSADPAAPDQAWKKKSKEEKAEEQDAAAAAAERKRKDKLARVIVLKWPETSTDYTDDIVQRNVKSRIARPEALFFPEVDLYQNGRKVRDRTVVPAMQPAMVPDSAVAAVMDVVDDIAGVPWNAKRPEEWGLKAMEMQSLAEQIWFLDRVNLREPMFLLYAQIGRAAENQNHPAPPFYESIGSFTVNYYYYAAAALAYQEPALMSKLTDQEVNASINYYLQQLQQGQFPSLKVDFEQENVWDPDGFNKAYEVLVNGIPVEVDANGQIDVFLGRTDIYLKRKDTGHGLSERLEVLKLEEKYYFVRDVARKRMGIDFIEQLFLHKNECTPEVDGDILNYLAIYAKIHDKAEIYIAVPEGGNANKVWIWRYDRASAMLNLVGGGPDSFPVRFALVASAGLMFNGASVTFDTSLGEDDAEVPGLDGVRAKADKTLENGFLPVNFELRGHYNRLMVNIGAEFGYNTAEEAVWTERYYLPIGKGDEFAGYDTVVATPGGEDLFSSGEFVEALHYTEWNRFLYIGSGIVLGRDAGLGFGPRFALRTGWTNLPHAWQTDAHFGWTYQPPVGDFGKRFRPLVDADLRGGVSVAAKNSLQRDIACYSNPDREGCERVVVDDSDEQKAISINDEGVVMPVFGITAGIGFTF